VCTRWNKDEWDEATSNENEPMSSWCVAADGNPRRRMVLLSKNGKLAARSEVQVSCILATPERFVILKTIIFF
jgi:hypothetical protein